MTKAATTESSVLSREFNAKSLWDSKLYTRKLIPDPDGGYTAEVQEFPGCIAEGDSADDALENLQDAALAWMQSQHELGRPIPDPADLFAYSGKIALRIPRGLHKQAAELAELDGVSLNQFLIFAISAMAGQKSLVGELRTELRKVGSAPSVTFVRLEGMSNRGEAVRAPVHMRHEMQSFFNGMMTLGTLDSMKKSVSHG